MASQDQVKYNQVIQIHLVRLTEYNFHNVFRPIIGDCQLKKFTIQFPSNVSKVLFKLAISKILADGSVNVGIKKVLAHHRSPGVMGRKAMAGL